MASVVNLLQASTYGFNYQWGLQVFGGFFNIGNINSNLGRYEQDWTAEDILFNGEIQYINGTTYPYSILNGPTSYIYGGETLGGASVSYAEWTSPSTQSEPYNSYLNLYYLLAPLPNQPAGQNYSATLSAMEPAGYDVIPPPPSVVVQNPNGTIQASNGGSYIWGVDEEPPYDDTGLTYATGYTPGTFNVLNSVSDSAVTYNTSQNGSISISEGYVSYNGTALAAGTNLNYQFQFIPGADGALTIQSAFNQSVTSSQTQGTSQSTSSSGSNTATFGITASQTATVGLDSTTSTSLSQSLQESYSDAWQQAWGKTESANFSTTNAISATDNFSFTITENLDTATPTGSTAPTANGGTTPLYQYSTTYTDASTGDTTTTSFTLVPFADYEWTLQYNDGIIQNTTTGQYTLTGDAGTLSDSSGNIVGGNIAQAFYYANQANAWAALGYDYNPTESFNSDTPSEINSVLINGSTVSSTSADVNLILTLSAVSSESSGSGNGNGNTLNSSSLLLAEDEQHSDSKLKSLDLTKIGDGLIVAPSISLTSTSYYGDDGNSRVLDTRGQDFIRTSGGRDYVKIRGNSIQPDNSGDIVYLGSGSDVVDATKAVGHNSIIADSGNDTIYDSKTNLSVDFGSGSDKFIYKGGDDMIKLGSGGDVIDLSSGSGSVVVADFTVGDDLITGLGRNSRLVWQAETRSFLIKNSDRVSGSLFTVNSEESDLSPEFWSGIGLQNVKELRLQNLDWDGTQWLSIRNKYTIHGFKDSLSTDDWIAYSASEKNIDKAAVILAKSAGAPMLSKSDINAIHQLADYSTSFTQFIASANGYLFSLTDGINTGSV